MTPIQSGKNPEDKNKKGCRLKSKADSPDDLSLVLHLNIRCLMELRASEKKEVLPVPSGPVVSIAEPAEGPVPVTTKRENKAFSHNRRDEVGEVLLLTSILLLRSH
jgi:hypothetical protein